MKKDLNLLYVELLKFPNSPKVYRELEAYYLNNNKLQIAKAFNHLLSVRFNETPVLYDNNSNSNQK